MKWVCTCTGMRCVFTDGVVFVNIIESMKDFCPNGNIDFSSEGMHMQVLDAAHVAMCSMVLRTNVFETFCCPAPLSLGVNFKTLSMMLKNAKGRLEMKSNGNKLELCLQKMSGTAEYSMNLMNIDSEHLSIPVMVSPATCVLSAATFCKVMRDVSEFSDTCKLQIGDTFSVSAHGDIGSVGWTSEDCTCNVISSVPAEEFSLRYLSLFSKCSVSSKVVICMSLNMPVSVTFPIDHGFMRFYLAPKIVE